MTLKYERWPWKTIRHLFYATSSFVHNFKAIGEFKLELQSRNTQFGSKSVIFLSHVTLNFGGWPWKTIGHLFYATSSFMHHLIAISEFKLELQSGKAQFMSKSMIFFVPCDLEIWQMTLKAIGHLFYATSSFLHHFVDICKFKLQLQSGNAQFGSTMTSSWPWPFAWTSPLSMVITPENFMMIRSQEHCQRGVTDRQTDRQTKCS